MGTGHAPDADLLGSIALHLAVRFEPRLAPHIHHPQCPPHAQDRACARAFAAILEMGTPHPVWRIKYILEKVWVCPCPCPPPVGSWWLLHCRGRGGGEFFFQKSDGLYYKEIGCRNSPEMCVSLQKRSSFSSKKVMGSIKTEIDCRNAHFVQISRGFLSKKVRGVCVPPHVRTGRTPSKSTF